MSARHIVVLGGGFAGLWSAAAAVRKLDELGHGPDSVRVTLVNRDAFHSIRVRNYEADLSTVRVPLDDVLGPLGVHRVQGDVVGLDLGQQTIAVRTTDGEISLPYDRVVFGLGSQLARPPLPGLVEHTFDVDTYDGAIRLDAHLHTLPHRPEAPGRGTVVVVGAGLTGIETACEMPARLRAILGSDAAIRVVLADRSQHVGSDMGESARPVIEQALSTLGIQPRLGIDVVAVDAEGLTLAGGERLPAATVVWCAGMRASPLTRFFPVAHDRLGRLPVDDCLRVRGVPHAFAAGDSAAAEVDDGRLSVMSCQHGRPMGRFAGHNVVCDLFGRPMLPLRIAWYVTVLDLGPWGAVYTEGWDRHVVTQGLTAKKTKQIINCERIYPPRSGQRADILAAAAPVVQQPPQK